MRWHEQVLPGWGGSPLLLARAALVPRLLAKDTRLSCSLPDHERQVSCLTRAATDTSGGPAVLTVSPGLRARDRFCQTCSSHQDSSLCCTSRREGDTLQNLPGTCSLRDALPRFS